MVLTAEQLVQMGPARLVAAAALVGLAEQTHKPQLAVVLVARQVVACPEVLEAPQCLA
jgi:hypothetical protein